MEELNKRLTKKNIQSSIKDQLKQISKETIIKIDRHMAELTDKGYYNHYSKETRKLYYNSQRKFWIIMLWKRNKQPDEILKEDIQEYLNKIPSDRFNYKQSLKTPILSYYNKVKDKKWEKFNIGRKDVRKWDILTHDDFAKIIDVCKTELEKNQLTFMKETGARSYETRHVKISDFKVGENKVRINGKGRKQRDVPISARAFTALYRFALQNSNDETKFVYANPKTQKPYTRQGLNKLVKRTAKRAQIDKKVSSHSYRRTYATMIYYGNGNDIVLTSKLMGHADIRQTRDYIQDHGKNTSLTITPSMLATQESQQRELVKLQPQAFQLGKRCQQPVYNDEFMKLVLKQQETIDRLSKQLEESQKRHEKKDERIQELDSENLRLHIERDQPTWFEPVKYMKRSIEEVVFHGKKSNQTFIKVNRHGDKID